MNFKDALKRIRQTAELLDDEDPDKQEMLDVEGDYSSLMDWAIKKRTEALSMGHANKMLAETYQERKKRCDNKADRFKDIITTLMNSANEEKYTGNYGTVTIKKVPPKPIVTDESKIPDEYKKYSIDKTAINKAVKEGLQIDGVSMDNGSVTTTIRVN